MALNFGFPSSAQQISGQGGIITQPWFRFFQALFSRFNNATAGWTLPTGTVDRSSFDANWTQSISNPPTQAEVQAVVAQVIVLQKHLAALETDMVKFGTIQTP